MTYPQDPDPYRPQGSPGSGDQPGGWQQPPAYGQPGGYQPYTGPNDYQYGGYASGHELAGWWYRVGATIIDGIIFGVPGAIIAVAIFSASTGSVGGQLAVQGVVSLIEVAYVVLMLGGNKGRTVGNMAVGTQVIVEATGQPPTYGKAFLRWLVDVALRIIPILGLIGGLLDILWPLWDSKNQSLHDKAAGTLVVKVR